MLVAGITIEGRGRRFAQGALPTNATTKSAGPRGHFSASMKPLEPSLRTQEETGKPQSARP